MMTLQCEKIFQKLCERFSFTPITVGYIICWLDVCCRYAVIIYIASIIETTQKSLQAPMVAATVLYGFLTLALNMLSLVGLKKKTSWFILPYICLLGFETIAGMIAVIALGILFYMMNDMFRLLISVFCGAFLDGLWISQWLYLTKIFRTIHKDMINLDSEPNLPKSSIFSVLKIHFRHSDQFVVNT